VLASRFRQGGPWREEKNRRNARTCVGMCFGRAEIARCGERIADGRPKGSSDVVGRTVESERRDVVERSGSFGSDSDSVYISLA
jgi:hypothetical protein